MLDQSHEIVGSSYLFVIDHRFELLAIGLNGAQDVGWKYGSEQSGADDVRIDKREYERETQTEANEIWPSCFDVIDATFDIPAFIAPFVFECIERVEKRQMNLTEKVSEPVEGQEANQ